MTGIRMLVVLVLSAGAIVVVLFGAPGVLAVLVVGSFMLIAPGLVLVELLSVRDALLEVVLVLMAGPAFWGVVATFEVFCGLWQPRLSMVVVAVVLGVAATALLSRLLHPVADEVDARHRFHAHPHDRVEFDESGRHKATFPSPHK